MLFFILFLFTACQTPKTTPVILGHVEQGRYYDYNGLFSMPIENTQIRSEYFPHPMTSKVVFRDERGTLQVEVFKGLFESKLVDTQGKKAEKLFTFFVYPRLSDHSTVIKEHTEVLKSPPAYYAEVMINQEPASLFVFFVGDLLYVLTYKGASSKEKLLEFHKDLTAHGKF